MKRTVVIFSLLVLLTACKNEETSKLIDNNISHNSKENKSVIVPESFQPQEMVPEIESQIPTGIYQDKEGFYHLQYVLEVGKTYYFNSKDIGKMTISSRGESMTETQETHDLLNIKVLDFKEGKYNLQVTMGGKKEIIKADGKQLVLDTNGKQPSEPELVKVWKLKRAISHAVFTMDMDVYGTVSNIRGLESVHIQAKKALGADFNGEELTNILKSIKEALNPEFFKAIFESSLVKFPQKGLKIGEKWNNNPAMKDRGYNQLIKVDENTAEVKIVAIIKPQFHKETDENGVLHTLSAKGSQEGIMTIDNKSGWILKGKFSVISTETETAKKEDQSRSITKKVENYHYINQ